MLGVLLTQSYLLITRECDQGGPHIYVKTTRDAVPWTHAGVVYARFDVVMGQHQWTRQGHQQTGQQNLDRLDKVKLCFHIYFFIFLPLSLVYLLSVLKQYSIKYAINIIYTKYLFKYSCHISE